MTAPVKKRPKKKDADCGCNAAHGSDDGDYAAEIEAFAALLQADAPAEVDVTPDPRGTKVRRWSGLIAPYGIPTGDGRRFRIDALSSRQLPLPVKWQRTDNQGHSTSVTVGRIDGVDYTPDGVNAWGIIFDPDREQLPRLAEDANEAYELLKQRVIGPSVDLDDMEAHPIPAEAGSDFAAEDKQELEVTKGRISAITLVQIPAFAEARPFALDDLDADEYAEMTAVTAAGVAQGMDALPVADEVDWDPANWLFTSLDLDGAGALYQRDDVALFPVAQLVDGELQLLPGAVADAVSVLAYHDQDIQLGEGTKQALREELESLTAACGLPSPPWAADALAASAGLTALVASAGPPPAELFANPKFTEPTPIRVREVGGHLHYSGHVATWGVCHIGFPGQCVTAPRSKTNYSYFHVGSTATAGGRVATGKISLGGGHADVRKGFQAAVEHYDSTSTAAADVRAGEDEHGIWVSGVVRPGIEAQRLAELSSAPLSGDWRRIGGGMEMVAALAVNTPGFPVPHLRRAGGQELALVAAGVLQPEAAPEPVLRRPAPAIKARAAAFADAGGQFDQLNQRAQRLTAARAFL
jgi:hypothetical protein